MKRKCFVCGKPTPTRGPMAGDDFCSNRCRFSAWREQGSLVNKFGVPLVKGRRKP